MSPPPASCAPRRCLRSARGVRRAVLGGVHRAAGRRPPAFQFTPAPRRQTRARQACQTPAQLQLALLLRVPSARCMPRLTRAKVVHDHQRRPQPHGLRGQSTTESGAPRAAWMHAPNAPSSPGLMHLCYPCREVSRAMAPADSPPPRTPTRTHTHTHACPPAARVGAAVPPPHPG